MGYPNRQEWRNPTAHYIYNTAYVTTCSLHTLVQQYGEIIPRNTILYTGIWYSVDTSLVVIIHFPDDEKILKTTITMKQPALQNLLSICNGIQNRLQRNHQSRSRNQCCQMTWQLHINLTKAGPHTVTVLSKMREQTVTYFTTFH